MTAALYNVGVHCRICGEEMTADDRTGEQYCGCDHATTVVNKRTADYDVDICRPSIWGNPFQIGRHGTREEVIELFRQRMHNQPYLVKLAKERLKGRRLGCVCKPLPCHGDVWAEICDNWPEPVMEAN